MKFFDCGKEFSGSGVRAIRSFGQSLASYWKNRDIQVTICTECAEQRAKVTKFYGMVFCIAIGAIVLITILVARR
jgi:hypothetical protein